MTRLANTVRDAFLRFVENELEEERLEIVRRQHRLQRLRVQAGRLEKGHLPTETTMSEYRTGAQRAS